MELDKEEPCMKIVNTEEFNALMNEDVVLVDFFATWCGHLYLNQSQIN